MLKTGNKKQTARKEEKEQTKQNLKAVHSSKRQMEKLKNEQVLTKCKQKNENILQTKTLPVRTEQCQPQKDINVKKVQKKTAPQPKDDGHFFKSVKPTAMAVRDLDLDEVSCEDSRLTGNGREVSEDKDGNRFGDTQQNMHCYLETCIFLGDMNKAQQCLNYYLQHPVRKTQLNVAMFNLLLKEWAKKVREAKACWNQWSWP